MDGPEEGLIESWDFQKLSHSADRHFRTPLKKRKKYLLSFCELLKETVRCCLISTHDWGKSQKKGGGGWVLNRKSLRKARHLQYFLYFLDFKSINWSEQETWCISAPLWSVQKIADEKKKKECHKTILKCHGLQFHFSWASKSVVRSLIFLAESSKVQAGLKNCNRIRWKND